MINLRRRKNSTPRKNMCYSAFFQIYHISGKTQIAFFLWLFLIRSTQGEKYIIRKHFFSNIKNPLYDVMNILGFRLLHKTLGPPFSICVFLTVLMGKSLFFFNSLNQDFLIQNKIVNSYLRPARPTSNVILYSDPTKN